MARALPALLAASCLALAAGAAAEGEDGPATLAVLLVGKRARWEGSVEEEDDGTLFERTVAPALRERVLRVGAESGAFAAVDVVGHLWAGGERDSLGDQKGVEAALKMRDVLHTTVKGLPGVRVVAFHHEPVTTHPPEVCASPERRPTKGPDNCQRLGYFDSAESALALLRKHGTPGRPFVVVVRWDVVFYRSFEAHLLNRELFYRASWCRAGGRAHAEDAKCRQLVPVLHGPQPNPTCSDKGGVPDFVFSGPAWAMHAVFDSAVEDLVNGVYREDGCNVNHGVMAGRLAWAEREKGVQLGRYMVHFLEFDYLRNAPDQRRFYHDDRNKCVQALPQPTRDAYYMTTAPGSGRVSAANLTAHDVRAPQGPSVCGPDIYFCACGPMNYAAFDGARTGG